MLLRLLFTLPALMALSSAMTLERNAPTPGEISILIGTDAPARGIRAPLFSAPTSACEQEDEDDCKEFCRLSEQTAKCTASGNKVTCSCKGGKSESKCEERCLLCMPDKSALEEASRLFKLGGSGKEDL